MISTSGKVFGLASVTKALRNAEKQIAYGSAKTYTGAAFEARKAIQANLPKWLILRNRFLPSSVIVERATPRNPAAYVGFHKRADWVEILEEGGKRRPKRSRNIAIPQGVRAQQNQKIPKRLTPSALMGRKDVFRKTINGLDGLWQLLPNKRLKLLYNFDPQTEYEPNKIHFYKTASAVAMKYIERNLERNVAEAFRSAK